MPSGIVTANILYLWNCFFFFFFVSQLQTNIISVKLFHCLSFNPKAIELQTSDDLNINASLICCHELSLGEGLKDTLAMSSDVY